MLSETTVYRDLSETISLGVVIRLLRGARRATVSDGTAGS